MSTAPDVFAAAGLPVEIGRIEKELGRLWEDNAETKTRASLLNLAIYTEDPDGLAANTELIAQLAGEHACRALLILGAPTDTSSSARAWIGAHCHLVGQGTRQICSEQITFYLPGESAGALSNLVFSHLDSDLPLVFWWQAGLAPFLAQNIWPWVDRLLFDSASWTAPGHEFHLLLDAAACAQNRPGRQTILCDLNWTRLLGNRFALASLFDHPTALEHLPQLTEIHLHHSPGCRTAAVLFLGWIASRLRWTLQPLLGQHVLTDPNSQPPGREIHFSLTETTGPASHPALISCALHAPGAKFTLSRSGEAPFYQLDIEIPGHPPISQLVQAEAGDLSNLVLAELGRGGSHPGLHQALEIVLPLL